jgi:hypothetical protein
LSDVTESTSMAASLVPTESIWNSRLHRAESTDVICFFVIR